MRIIKKIYRIFYSFSNNIKRLNVDAYAACTAFFLILSVTPMMILLCSILPLTPITENDLVTFLSELLPDIFAGTVSKLISSIYSGGYAVITFSALLTLWTAGKGMSSIIQGLNAINGVEEKRNYFHKRAVCALYTLIFLSAIFLSLLLMVFGQQIADYLIALDPNWEPIQHILIAPRYLYLFIILSFVFTFMLAFLPNKHQKFREQLPGGVLCSAAWLLFSFLFSVYVKHFNPFNMYGNLAIIVVAMFWLYFCMIILFYCAYINKYFKPINIVLVYSGKQRRILFGDNIPKLDDHEAKKREEEAALAASLEAQDYLE